MFNRLTGLGVSTAAAGFAAGVWRMESTLCSESDIKRPPVAAKRPVTVTFGKVTGENRGNGATLMDPPITQVDNYYWMRDDERKHPDVIAHLNAENAYCG